MDRFVLRVWMAMALLIGHVGASMAGFPAGIELSGLNGVNGVIIEGVNAADHSGWSVGTAGDLNADGVDDLVIGAPDADPNALFAGAVYVVFGTNQGFASPLDLSTLDGTDGFVIHGEAQFDGAGWSVAPAGDVNGDGIDDLVIGAPFANPGDAVGAGVTYVVFGTDQVFTSPFELSAINGDNGIVITGIAENDSSGTSVSSAGDINADTLDDLVIGAPFANPGGRAGAGVTYVVFGAAELPSPLDLATLNGTNGFAIHGILEGDSSGTSVSTAGDVDNDGFDDMLIGAPIAGPAGANPGMAYVVFGSAGPWATSFELADLDGDNGFAINGVTTGDQLGSAVAAAGDVDGDGFDDVILGAPQPDPINGPGVTYVLFGSAPDWPATVNLSGLDGGNGFALNGVSAGDAAGTSVRAAGDIDMDGFGDVILGAPLTDPNGSASGAAYLVHGSDQAWPSAIDLSTLDGTVGFSLNGAAGDDRAGRSVGYAGDVNQDGAADFLVGAPGDPLGDSAGTSYLVFGEPDPGGDVIFADGFE